MRNWALFVAEKKILFSSSSAFPNFTVKLGERQKRKEEVDGTAFFVVGTSSRPSLPHTDRHPLIFSLFFAQKNKEKFSGKTPIFAKKERENNIQVRRSSSSNNSAESEGKRG